jgi:integrase
LRDRALIATLTYSFARINAALKMKVEDLRPQGAGWRLRLHEKGGKHHAMPCHHALAEAAARLYRRRRHRRGPQGLAVPYRARPQSRYAVRPRDEPVRRLVHDPPPTGVGSRKAQDRPCGA